MRWRNLLLFQQSHTSIFYLNFFDSTSSYQQSLAFKRLLIFLKCHDKGCRVFVDFVDKSSECALNNRSNTAVGTECRITACAKDNSEIVPLLTRHLFCPWLHLSVRDLFQLPHAAPVAEYFTKQFEWNALYRSVVYTTLNIYISALAILQILQVLSHETSDAGYKFSDAARFQRS